VNVDLRLVCTSAHDPIAILADPDTVACLLELKVLQELDTILVLGIVLQASLSAPGKPVWKGASCRRPRDCVDGNGSRIGKLHGRESQNES
jgi:hypothetical protein